MSQRLVQWCLQGCASNLVSDRIEKCLGDDGCDVFHHGQVEGGIELGANSNENLADQFDGSNSSTTRVHNDGVKFVHGIFDNFNGSTFLWWFLLFVLGISGGGVFGGFVQALVGASQQLQKK